MHIIILQRSEQKKKRRSQLRTVVRVYGKMEPMKAAVRDAKKIIDTMKQKQTADVDVASGATYSSKGIIAAVRNALKEAS